MYALLAVLALSLGPARAVTAPVAGPYAIAGQMDMASSDDMRLAVWTDGRSRDTFQLKAARITWDYEALDPEGIAVSRFPETRIALDPHVVWDGKRFVVAWYDDLHTPWVSAIAPDGTVATPRKIGEVNSPVRALATNGGNTLLVISAYDAGTTLAGFIDDELQFTPATTIHETVANPTVASLAGGYVLLWSDAARNVRALKLDEYAQPAGDAFTLTSLGTFGTSPLLVAEPNVPTDEVVIAASDFSRLAVTLLKPDGTTTGGTELTGQDAQLYVDAVVPHDLGIDIVAHRYDAPVIISMNHDAQQPLSWTVDHGKYTFAGAGAATRGDSYAIWNIDHNIAGIPAHIADTELEVLSQAPRAQLAPAIATNGSSTLVAWQEGQDGTLTNFDVRASVDGGEAITIGESIDDRLSAPAIAFDGHDWVIAWKDDLVTGEQLYQHLYMRHLAADGTLGATQTISSTAHDAYTPAMASDGAGGVLLAWAEGAWFHEPQVRVQLAGHDGFDMPGGRGTPSIVFDGTHYLVTATTAAGDIIGMFVDAAGAASASFTIGTGAQMTTNAPAAAWNGELFLVVYRKGLATAARYVSREGVPIGDEFFLPFSSIQSRVAAYRGSFVVSIDGKLQMLGETPVPFGEQVIDCALAPGVIAYTSHASELQRVPRVFTRILGLPRTRAIRH